MSVPRRMSLLLASLLAFGASPTASADVPDSLSAVTAPTTAVDAPMRPNWFYYVKGEQLVRVDATPLETRESVGAGDLAAHMLWGGGGKSWMTLSGPTSEIRIAESQPRFRVATQRVAALMVRLAPFEVRKDNRWAQTDLSRQQAFFKKAVPLSMNKIGDDLYELIPSKPLEPGEYGLALSAAGPVTDFTIVAAETKKAE